MKPITTIKLQKETKSRLDKFKEHDRETYDEILKKILFILNTIRKTPEKASGILRNIDRNIRRKKGYTQVPQKPKSSQTISNQ